MPLMSFDVQEYFDELTTSDVILSFKGSITSDMINNVLDTVESKLTEDDEDPKIRKKMYNVLVESLQNLYHHIDDLPEEFEYEILEEDISDDKAVVKIKLVSDLYGEEEDELWLVKEADGWKITMDDYSEYYYDTDTCIE